MQRRGLKPSKHNADRRHWKSAVNGLAARNNSVFYLAILKQSNNFIMVTLKTKELQKALAFAMQVLENNPVMQVLEKVLIVADGANNTCSVRMTNLKTDVEMVISCEGSFHGVIPAKKLSEILKTVGDTITIKEEKSKIVIKHSQGHREGFFVVSGDPDTAKTFEVDGFPLKAKLVNPLQFSFNGIELQKALNNCFCVSTDELRAAMTGIYFDFQDKCMVSTDAHKLAWQQMPKFEGENAGLAVIVPPIAQKLLGSIKIDGEVDVFVDSTRIEFVGESFEFSCGLIDAKYPQYKGVLPIDQMEEKYKLKDKDEVFVQKKMLAQINKAHLMKGLNTALVGANKTTSQVKLSFGESSLQIIAQDLDYGYESCIEIAANTNWKGEFLTAFNAKFLLQTLAVSETDANGNIHWEQFEGRYEVCGDGLKKKDGKCAIIHSGEKWKWFGLAMPVMIKD